MDVNSVIGSEKSRRVLWLAGSLIVAGCALVLLLTAFRHSAVAGVWQVPHYVDGVLGSDESGCGIQPGPQACRTIQYAIDAGYDAISVTGGVYTESVRIAQDLALQGGWDVDFDIWDPASNETVVAGQSLTGAYAIAVLTGTKVHLDGLTVFRGDDGVHLYADAEARLTRLRVHGTGDEGVESNGDGLWLSGVEIFDTRDNGVLVEAGSAEIYGSVVHDTGDRGIYLRGGGAGTISGTVVYRTLDDGIRARDLLTALLFNNHVYSSTADGIQIDDVVSASVEMNRVHAAGRDGIKLDGAARAVLRANTVYSVSNEGLQIQKGDAVTVTGNVVYRTGADGVLAQNDGGVVLIRANQVYSTMAPAQDGIHVSPGVKAVVEDNLVHHVTGDAVDFKGLSGTIQDNRLYDVGDVGIQVTDTLSISIVGNHLDRVTRDGIQVEETGSASIRDNYISHTLTGTAAIYVGRRVPATIDGNRIYAAAIDGINFQGTLGFIRNNRVSGAGDEGINVNGNYAEVSGNTVHDTQNECLRVRSGSVVSVTDNLFYDTLGAQEDGIRVEPNVTATIVANTVHHATDDGITFNGNVGTISENHLYDNGASGIDVDAGTVTIAANRIFHNGEVGIELEQAGQFVVSNNLVGENRAGGVRLMGLSTGRLVNNSLVGRLGSGTAVPIPIEVGVQVLSPTVALTSANNIVISHTTGISVAGGASVVSMYDDVWGNLVNFVGLGSSVGSLEADPMLVDAAGRDYHLRAGSPCIDAGLDSLAPPADFEGHSRLGQADIGADEFVGTLIFNQYIYLPFVVKGYD